MMKDTNMSNESMKQDEKMKEDKPTDKANSEKISFFKSLFKVKSDGFDYRVLNIAIKFISLMVGILLLYYVMTLIGTPIIAGVTSLLSILAPFIIGIAIAVLVYPLVKKRKKTVSGVGEVQYIRSVDVLLVSIATILLIIFLIAGSVFLIGSTMTGFMQDYKADLQNGKLEENIISDTVYEFLDDIPLGEEYTVEIGEKCNGDIVATELTCTPKLFNDKGQFNYQDIITNASSNISLVTSFVLFAATIVFVTPFVGKFNKIVAVMIPRKVRKETLPILNIFGSSFSKYIKGQVFIASLVGLFSGALILIAALFATFALDYSGDFILSFNDGNVWMTLLIILIMIVICATTNLIPMVGPFIGGGVVGILSLFSEIRLDEYNEIPWITILILAGIVVIQQTESMTLQPRIMGKIGKINGFLILVSLTLFGALFGIVGMIISTPILFSLKQVIQHYDDKYNIFTNEHGEIDNMEHRLT